MTADVDLSRMADIGDIDLALLPVWSWAPRLGPRHMNPEQAAAAERTAPEVRILLAPPGKTAPTPR